MPAAIPFVSRLCDRASPRGDRHVYAAASALSTRRTTGTRCAPRVSRASIEAGPPSIWRYADLLPVEAPDEPRLAPGLTPLVPAPRLAEELGIGELWLKLDTANPTHSFKDRVVAVAARKAQELGFDTLSCSSTGNLAGAVAARAAAEGLEAAVFVPSRPRAGEARGRSRLRPPDLRRRRHVRPLLPPFGRAVLRAAVGLRQRQPALVLRRGLEDARVRDRRAARLGDAGRRRDPDRLGGALPQGRPGLLGATRARPRRGRRRRRSSAGRRQAASRWRPRSARAAASCPCGPTAIARSLAIGNPADGDFAVATARATGGAVYTVPEDEIGPNMAHLAATTGVFGETATGVTLGALRAAVGRRPPRAGGRASCSSSPATG